MPLLRILTQLPLLVTLGIPASWLSVTGPQLLIGDVAIGPPVGRKSSSIVVIVVAVLVAVMLALITVILIILIIVIILSMKVVLVVQVPVK